MAESAGGKSVGRISIRVVPDTSKFRQELRRELEKIEKEESATVRVTADFDAKGLSDKVDAAAKAAKSNVKIKADLDQTDLSKTVAEAKALAKAAGVKLNIDIEDKKAEADLAKVIAKLKAEAKLAKINVKVDVDKSNLSGIKSALGGIFGGGANAAGKGFGAFSQFLDTAVLVAAVASIIAPALALISGAVVALPAILTGILVPIAAVALGFQGIGKAAQEAGLLGTGKKGKTTIGAGIKELQAALGKKFQDGFTPIFKQIVPLFPVLAQGLFPVADGVIKIAQSLTQMITKVTSLNSIKAIFDNIGRALTVAAPGIAAFSEGFIKLIEGGSRSLPGFARLFGRMGDSLNDWTTKINQPGFLGLSQIEVALSNFQTILGKFGGLFGDIFTKSFDMLSDPKFAATMGQFVDDLKTIVDVLLPALKQFFSDLSQPFHDLSTLIGFLPKVDTSKPKPGEPGGGAKLPGQNSFFPGFLPEAKANIAAATQFATIPTLILNNWAPISGFFVNLWNTIANSAFTVGGVIRTTFQEVVANITADLSNIGSSLVGIWDSMVGSARAAFSSLAQAVSQTVSQVISTVTAVPGQIASVFANAAGLLFDAGRNLIQGLINGISSAIGGAISAAQKAASSVADAVRGALGIHSPSTVFADIGQYSMQGLQQGLEGGFQGVIGRAKALADQLASAIRDGVVPQGLKNQLKQELKELSLEYQQLKVDKNNTTDPGQKKAITAQMQQIQALKDQLTLQQKQVGFSNEFGKSMDSTNDAAQAITQVVSNMIDSIKGFATANLQQFESDLGISGNGTIPQLADQGIGFLTQTLSTMASNAFGGSGGGGVNIQVNSVDEALAARQNIVNKNAMQYAGR